MTLTRDNAIKSIKARIDELHRAVNIIKRLPVHVPVHIVYEDCTVGEGNGPIPTTRQDNEMVIKANKFISSEIMCDVLAVEKPWWKAKEFIVSIEFTKIKSWKPFDKNDAGLYVNWSLLSEEFKKIAFGK